MEAVFREYVAEAKGRGATVLLSSHILTEVEKLCDRVSIIREGRTVDSGTLAELRHLSRTTISARLSRPPVGLDAIGGRVRRSTVDCDSVHCQVDPEALERCCGRWPTSGSRP
jgi:ABC-2 type transport system ATP-binding protein